ncbi:MAG: primosome assembly protein PriA [Candidatus Nanopelagicales bacterium]|nr:primosome assembly protein PriA [Candidatus Nanopelagicales bacterium]MDZ4250829.1 primosome assembly protein PriA [Candidatus Nanopelagicales bacterium]
MPESAGKSGAGRIPGQDVARVLVDTSLPHMDRLFDYSVPEDLDKAASPGARVRVRLGPRTHDGFVISRCHGSDHGSRLRPIDSVVSPVPVLTPEVADLSRMVADHYAGSMFDVVRLAVPPRHAGAERAWPEMELAPADPTRAVPDPDRLRAWSAYPAGAAFAAHVADGEPARAVWSCAPAGRWTVALAGLVTQVAGAGGGVVVVLPDRTDVEDLVSAIGPEIPEPWLSVLRADVGPAARYREFLRVLSGQARVVIGTRAASFAPVANLRLAAIWDDADPSHCEMRAPYPHAREVLALRSRLTGCALLVGGYHRTCEAQQWVETGWAHEVNPDVSETRRLRPTVTALGAAGPVEAVRRIPSGAAAALREGLESGPVLVVTARRGYVPVTACQQCRELAQCPKCGGTLTITEGPDVEPGHSRIRCAACESPGQDWTCPECGGTKLRAVRVGALRTAEELGRMFPGLPVIISTGERPTRQAEDRPALVVATSGVEPVAENGYAAAAFLDARLDLRRPDVRASEQALHRWMNACALLRPGAKVMIVADSDEPCVQALIRWDPAGFAAAELERRAELAMPPAVPMVRFDGTEQDLRTVAEAMGGIDGIRVRGPRPVADEFPRTRAAEPTTQYRLLVSWADAGLAGEARRLVVAMSSAHRGGAIRVQVDPFVIE